jgi:hypothetical protein
LFWVGLPGWINCIVIVCAYYDWFISLLNRLFESPGHLLRGKRSIYFNARTSLKQSSVIFSVFYFLPPAILSCSLNPWSMGFGACVVCQWLFYFCSQFTLAFAFFI